MNRGKIYVCACIWKTEINYLVNKNGHDWVEGMQLGEEIGYNVFTALKLWETTPHNIGYAILERSG